MSITREIRFDSDSFSKETRVPVDVVISFINHRPDKFRLSFRHVVDSFFLLEKGMERADLLLTAIELAGNYEEIKEVFLLTHNWQMSGEERVIAIKKMIFYAETMEQLKDILGWTDPYSILWRDAMRKLVTAYIARNVPVDDNIPF